MGHDFLQPIKNPWNGTPWILFNLNSWVFQHHEKPMNGDFNGDFMALNEHIIDFMGHEYGKFSQGFHGIFHAFFMHFSWHTSHKKYHEFTMKILRFSCELPMKNSQDFHGFWFHSVWNACEKTCENNVTFHTQNCVKIVWILCEKISLSERDRMCENCVKKKMCENNVTFHT